MTDQTGMINLFLRMFKSENKNMFTSVISSLAETKQVSKTGYHH